MYQDNRKSKSLNEALVVSPGCKPWEQGKTKNKSPEKGAGQENICRNG